MSHKDGTNSQVEKNYLKTDGNIMTQVQVTCISGMTN